MKILFVCHRFPFPPKRGGKIRPFNIIRHLAADHDVTVCSLARSDEEAREGEGIAPYCARYEMAQVSEPVQVMRMVARVATRVPSSMGYFYSPALAHRVRMLLSAEHFGFLLVHCVFVVLFVTVV